MTIALIRARHKSEKASLAIAQKSQKQTLAEAWNREIKNAQGNKPRVATLRPQAKTAKAALSAQHKEAKASIAARHKREIANTPKTGGGSGGGNTGWTGQTGWK